MKRTSPSPLLQEIVEFILLASLFAAWILFSFLPKGGLDSVAEAAVRAEVAAAGVAVLGTALSCALRRMRLVRWSPDVRRLVVLSPGVRRLHERREARAQDRRQLERRRLDLQRAAWQAVESVPERSEHRPWRRAGR